MLDKIKEMDSDHRQTWIIILLLVSILMFTITIVASINAVNKVNDYNEKLEKQGCLNIQTGSSDSNLFESGTIDKNIYNKAGVTS